MRSAPATRLNTIALDDRPDYASCGRERGDIVLEGRAQPVMITGGDTLPSYETKPNKPPKFWKRPTKVTVPPPVPNPNSTKDAGEKKQ